MSRSRRKKSAKNPSSGAVSAPIATPPAPVFIEKLGRALHRYGSPAHRLEEALMAVAERLGVRGQFFSTPTAIFAAFDRGPNTNEAGGSDAGRYGQDVILLRADPGDIDLEKLSRLDGVLSDVVHGGLDPGRAAREVDAIVEATPRYGPVVSTIAFALISGSAARFFGGGLNECLAALALGLVLGLLCLVVNRFPSAGRLFELIAAALAASLTTITAGLVPLSPDVVMVAGLIIFLPGFTLTVAMNELATRHLVSGSARIAGAALIFITLGFGVALGRRLGIAVVGDAPSAAPQDLAAWTEIPALLLTAIGFTVLFRARRTDVVWILLAAAAALGGSRIGVEVLGPQLGAFFGALMVGVGSNLFARLLDRPAAVMQLPGILLLVPGSIGFRGVSSFLAEDALAGVQSAFTMVLVAIALVTGLLVSNVVVPPRRAL